MRERMQLRQASRDDRAQARHDNFVRLSEDSRRRRSETMVPPAHNPVGRDGKQAGRGLFPVAKMVAGGYVGFFIEVVKAAVAICFDVRKSIMLDAAVFVKTARLFPPGCS